MEWNSSGIPKAMVKKIALPAMKITSSRPFGSGNGWLLMRPVIRETPLMRSQPGEETEIDVGVMACDIDIGVMQDDVLPPPQVGAPADQFQRHRHEFVDPGMVGIGLMATVVLDIEANPGRREAEQHCQQETLPPSLVHEDQQRIHHREPAEEDGRF